MLIFDVDGVICDLKDKKPNPKILEYISNELTDGYVVALNTGRSLDWIIKNILKTFLDDPKTKPFLKNFIIVGEKGAVWLIFKKNGKPQCFLDKSLSFSSNLKEEIRKIVKSNYSKSMFVDDGKQTAITTEMKDGYNIKEYLKDQKELIVKSNFLIKKHNLTDKLILSSNPIAVDIDSKGVGKDFGVKKILDILKKREIEIRKFITIGDMESDFKMAEELDNQGFTVTHIHVGDTDVNKNHKFVVKITKNKYEKGTLEFLKSL